ncbi:MAG: MerR family DNA-binding protein [Thermoleophilaceae bacterium]
MGLTVKQVADNVGLPSRTIRYYDRIGLVSADERSAAGYRLYSPEEEGKLRFIRRAKALGFSLADIRGLLAAADDGCCDAVMPEVERLLENKVSEIDAQIAELAAFRERLLEYSEEKGTGCGCRQAGAFCGCLDDVSQTTVAG